MIITARFASTCPSCGTRIQPGTRVEWERGAKATHTRCPNVQEDKAAVTRERFGRYTTRALLRWQENAASSAQLDPYVAEHWSYQMDCQIVAEILAYRRKAAAHQVRMDQETYGWDGTNEAEETERRFLRYGGLDHELEEADRLEEEAKAFAALADQQLVETEVGVEGSLERMQATWPTMDYMVECLRWNKEHSELRRVRDAILSVLLARGLERLPELLQERYWGLKQQLRERAEDRQVAAQKADRDARLAGVA